MLDQDRMRVPVERLEPATRCLLGEVVNSYTTSGVIGPVRTPIAPDLYEFLLDRPVILSSLLQRLGLAAYQFSPRGTNRFWVDDGDGTQGIFTLVYRDQIARIYHIAGHHQGRVFPLVRAKAAVFLRIVPVVAPDGGAGVETSLLCYTRLDDPVLAGLVRVLSPLVGAAVTRKVTRGFEVTNQLATLIAQDPDRIFQQVPSLPLTEPADLHAFSAFLHPVQRLPAQSLAPRPTP